MISDVTLGGWNRAASFTGTGAGAVPLAFKEERAQGCRRISDTAEAGSDQADVGDGFNSAGRDLKRIPAYLRNSSRSNPMTGRLHVRRCTMSTSHSINTRVVLGRKTLVIKAEPISGA